MDYIISEEQLHFMEYGYQLKTMAKTIRSRPLQQELQKERERVLSELSVIIHEWEVVAEGTQHWLSLNRVYRKIESLRGEP